MDYEFTKTDDKILDFLRDNWMDIVRQVRADSGESVYRYHNLKVTITDDSEKF